MREATSTRNLGYEYVMYFCEQYCYAHFEFCFVFFLSLRLQEEEEEEEEETLKYRFVRRPPSGKV